MNLVIPSIHYLAILPVLIFFGAALLLLLGAALARFKVPHGLATATVVLASVASLVVNVLQWRCVTKSGASTTIAHAIVLDDFAVIASAVIALSVVAA